MEGEIAENRIVVNVKPQTQTDASNVPYLLSFQSATEMSRIETSSGIYVRDVRKKVEGRVST